LAKGQHMTTPQGNFPARREDPFDLPPAYTQWRQAAGPIAKVTLPSGAESWVVTGYAEIRELLSDIEIANGITANRYSPHFPNTRSGVIGVDQASNIVFLDEPEHGKLRRALAPSFSAKTVNAMRPGIQRTIDDVIDRMLAGEKPADLHRVFSLPVPSGMICQLLGLPYEDHEFFEDVAIKLLSRETSREEHQQLQTSLYEYLQRAVHDRADAPTEGDLIGRLIINNVSKGQITLDQVAGLALVMLIAGHETTASSLTMMTAHLLNQPGLLAQLKADPSIIPALVEEELRLASIGDVFAARQAVKDFELGGCPIKAGDGVIALMAGGNHDPSVYEHSNAIDLSRSSRSHLAFGFGVHACIGQNLARVELELAITSLFDRVPTLELAVPFEALTWKHESMVFGAETLPVTW